MKKKIILIVDDDLTSRLILKVLLIKKGYGVISEHLTS